MIKRIFSLLGVILLVVCVVLGGVGAYIVRRPFPQINGEVSVPGLESRVEVYRDSYGVPHIYADSAHDLFFAQGYVQAQDRFWQMEFQRRIGQGRLAEILGDGALDTDRFIRTLGWARVAAEEEKMLAPEERVILQAFADGVNAYLSTHKHLGLEFTILSLNGAAIEPQPWTILNTLTWAKAMAWDLGGNMESELTRAMLIQKIGADATLEMLPLYPADHPIILPNPPTALDLAPTLAAVNQLSALAGGGFDDIGSNNWVIAGSRTDTGLPYLANDPHLGIQMPSIWYEVGLHCNTPSDACPYDVTGFAFASAPGVIIGHNSRIAWGFTNVGPDVQDLYIERINPDNPDQYEVNGEWADAQVIDEAILVKGRVDPDPEHPERDTGTYDPNTGMTTIHLPVRITRHGPLVNDVNDNAARLGGEVNGVQLPNPSALALRWTALDTTRTLAAILKLDRARNFDEFRQALRDFDAPSQNIIYADVDGNIGYQVPGRIPIRANGDGLLPVPGWSDDYEWTGYIPFDELPSSFNPPQGYLVTANNAVVGPDYPYLISLEWDRGYRARRIVDMLEGVEGQITKDYIAQMQGDASNLSAQEVMPYLAPLSFDDPKLQTGMNYLRAWDFQQTVDSGAAALYNLFWVRLIADTFYDELGEADYLWPGPGDETMLAVRNLLGQPDNHWWDNVTTADRRESRDDILRQAFAEAYADAESRLGADSAKWEWGDLHTATFRNLSLGRSGIAPIEALFNRGPVPAPGGVANVNNIGYRISLPSDKPNRPKTFETISLPSMRLIVDLSNLGNSRAMHTTGQSGHPFNRHYDDMIEHWRRVEYHPMLWERAQVEGAATAHLTLTP